MEHLRLTAMIEYVRSVMTGPAVLIGSSLGGGTAARVAERDDRVKALGLMAPAVPIGERWEAQLGAEWGDWQRSGGGGVHDYATGGTTKVDWGFIEDVATFKVEYADVTQPALVMHGRGDETVPIDYSRKFAAGKPNVRLVEYDDGHQLIDSLPKVLAESD